MPILFIAHFILEQTQHFGKKKKLKPKNTETRVFSPHTFALSTAPHSVDLDYCLFQVVLTSIFTWASASTTFRYYLSANLWLPEQSLELSCSMSLKNGCVLEEIFSLLPWSKPWFSQKKPWTNSLIIMVLVNVGFSSNLSTSCQERAVFALQWKADRILSSFISQISGYFNGTLSSVATCICQQYIRNTNMITRLIQESNSSNRKQREVILCHFSVQYMPSHILLLIILYLYV